MSVSQEKHTRTGEILIASANALRRYGLAQLMREISSRVCETDSVGGILSDIEHGNTGIVVVEFGPQAVVDEAALRQLHLSYPQVCFIAISPAPDQKLVMSALEAGARGFVDEADALVELVSAVFHVQNGQIYTPPALSEQSTEGVPSAQSVHIKLSGRQRELLPLIARGLSNKQIAQQLDISVSTAKFHVSTILRSLNSSNRTEAASKATLLLRAI